VSDISSTGIDARGACRKTYGKDVLRRVDVPVMPGAAGRALPRPGVQAQRREQMPARRAGLAGRVPAVDHDQVPSRLGRLVLQHLPEGSKALRDSPFPGRDELEAALLAAAPLIRADERGRIRQLGEADLEIVAREFILTLRARGWRPVMDRPPPLAGPVQAGGTGLPRAPEVRQLVEAAVAACEAATPVVRKDAPPRNVA